MVAVFYLKKVKTQTPCVTASGAFDLPGAPHDFGTLKPR
jgi:hypothetical protein